MVTVPIFAYTHAMAWDQTDSGKRRSYHHGNLREALVAAAIRLIQEKGPAGFTIAEAARVAGVSPAAPYRHFRDRDALLAEIAKQGFDEFSSRLKDGWRDGQPDPVAALHRLGGAYLSLAREQPATYAAMFEAGLCVADYPDLATASEAAFAVLRTACEAVAAALPAQQRPPGLMMALHIWSLSHGIASLFARGDKARRPLPMEPAELLEAAVLIYLDGLGARRP
jgi:AcrR family transcriptional regulator